MSRHQWIRRSATFVLAVAAIPALAPAARGQSNTFLQWNFNDSNLLVDLNLTTGTPLAAYLGGTAAAAAGEFADGAGSTDPAASNFAWNTSNYPAVGAASGTAGVQFNIPTTSATGGFDNVVVRFDQQNSATASRFFRLEYTLNGTSWTPAGVYATTLNDVFFTRTLDLSLVAGAANNPNLAFRTVAVFDPSGTDYAATLGTSTYGTGGTARFDMVTVSRGVRWSGATSSDATTAGNWAGGVLPGATDTVLLGAAANTTVNVPVAVTVGQLVFRTDAPSYTVSGAGPITPDAGVVNNSPNLQTITAPVSFPGSRTVENNGRLVFGGNVAVANNGNLNLTGSGVTAINGTYTGNDVNVTAGHTLGGVGTIQNEVQIYAAKVRGGFPDGTNNFGTLTINIVGGDLELYAAPGNAAPGIVIQVARTGLNTVQNSRIALTGGTGTDLELNDAGVGANKLRFEVIADNLVLGETYSMTILTTDSTGSIEFNNAGQADGFVFPTSSYDLVAPNYTFTNQQIQVVDVAGASTLVLTFTPVPEPATVLGVAAAGLAGLRLVRRRTRKTA